MKSLPINGRIAIIDDQIDQARPLIQEFSKRRLPFVYYDGSVENLPEEGEENDFRLMFLDINLIDNAVHNAKELYAKLNGVLGRLINKKNFPYVLVCWSRNQEEFEEILSKINEDFKDKLPIATIKLEKSHFFDLEGNKNEDFDEQISLLFDKISDAVTKHIAFKNLISWENIIHTATNKALAEGLECIDNKWEETIDWIFTKWSIAYSGRMFSYYKPKEKLQSAYHTLNHFLLETIEEEISNIPEDSIFNEDKEDRQISMSKFNEKLIFTHGNTKSKESGRIVASRDEIAMYKDILNFAIKRDDNSELIKRYEDNPDKTHKNIKEAYFKEVRAQIKSSWDIFKLVVNPVCDFAQNKVRMNRTIPGIFIEKKFKSLFNTNNDALYVSPNFYYRTKANEYFFILDFRFFSSEKEDRGESDLKLKQQVLAEILSKLSRHINRQGLLFIDD